jgi:nucleotide-binding universal stress UspA family protein
MKVKPTRKRGRVVVQVDRKEESLLAGEAGTPFSFRNILVPVDFSACSNKALQYARPLAHQFHSCLTLLYVMPANYFVGSEFGPVDFPVPEGEWRESSERQLKNLAASELGAEGNWRCVVRQGQPAHEIATYAASNDVDIIVISTHGRTGLRHVLVGSVAENVVRYAPCPVLVVREQERDFLPAQVRSSSKRQA